MGLGKRVRTFGLRVFLRYKINQVSRNRDKKIFAEGDKGSYLKDCLGVEWARSQSKFENIWHDEFFSPWLDGKNYFDINILDVMRTHIWSFVLRKKWIHWKINQKLQYEQEPGFHESPGGVSDNFNYFGKVLLSVFEEVRDHLIFPLIFSLSFVFAVFNLAFRNLLDRIFFSDFIISEEHQNSECVNQAFPKLVIGTSASEYSRVKEWFIPRYGRSVYVLLSPTIRASIPQVRKYILKLQAVGLQVRLIRPGLGINLREFISKCKTLLVELAGELKNHSEGFVNNHGTPGDLIRLGWIFGYHIALGAPTAEVVSERLGGGKWHFSGTGSGFVNALISQVRFKDGFSSHQTHGVIGDIFSYRSRCDLGYTWGQWDADLLKKYSWEKETRVDSPIAINQIKDREGMIGNKMDDGIKILVTSNLLILNFIHPSKQEDLNLPYGVRFIQIVTEWTDQLLANGVKKLTVDWKIHPRESAEIYRAIIKIREESPAENVNFRWIERMDLIQDQVYDIAISSLSSVIFEIMNRRVPIFLYDEPPHDRETFISCFSKRRKFHDQESLNSAYNGYLESGFSLQPERDALKRYRFGETKL